jgi:hypothetical protein
MLTVFLLSLAVPLGWVQKKKKAGLEIQVSGRDLPSMHKAALG